MTSAGSTRRPASIASRSAPTSPGPTRAAVSGAAPGRSTVTVGAAQQRPGQPAATTRARRPRRPTSAASAARVEAAPTERPQLPSPTARRISPGLASARAARSRAREPARRIHGLADGGPGVARGQGEGGGDGNAMTGGRASYSPRASADRSTGAGAPSTRSTSSGASRPRWQAVHLGQRRHGAVEGAVEALERPLAISGGAVGPDAEAALEGDRADRTQPCTRQDTPTQTRATRRPGAARRNSG